MEMSVMIETKVRFGLQITKREEEAERQFQIGDTVAERATIPERRKWQAGLTA